MSGMVYDYGLAFLAGLLSVFSPCVFSLVPPYLGYLSGVAVGTSRNNEDSHDKSDDQRVKYRKQNLLLTSIYFVLGMMTIFIVLGATASALGKALLAYRDYLRMGSGVLLILFGVFFLGFSVPWMNKEFKIQVFNKTMGGYFGAYVMGGLFFAGWTPCIGPILGSILVLAANSASLSSGVMLLFVYSLGMALPFVIMAFLMERGLRITCFWQKYIFWIQRVSGIILIALGILLVTNNFYYLTLYSPIAF